MEGALFVLISCIIALCSSQGPECNRHNEKLECVRVCPPEKSCRNRGIFFSCLNENTKKCQLKCVCIGGYIRNDKGECIPEKECDDFVGLRSKRYATEAERNIHFQIPEKKCLRPHEFYDCGSGCDNVCANLHLQNRTNCPIQNIVCNPGCYCRDGYARDEKGNCVPVEKCNNPALRERRATQDLFPVKECNGPNEFFQCGPACDNVCATLDKQNRTHCPIVNVICNSRCYCNDGYARDDSGKPASHSENPEGHCTGPNEIYTCQKTCPPGLCFSLVARFKCDPTEVCKPQCACKPGYLRVHEKSACVPICQCPEMRNSPDCHKM